MQSSKPRITSKSGKSGLSTGKPATSSKRENSSAAAPSSFETVFGKTPNQQEVKLTTLVNQTKEDLEYLTAQPEPVLALYRTMHRAKLARTEKRLRDLQEALQALKTD